MGINGVARIFFGGGPIFRDLRRPTRFGGGGVVAEIFRDRRKPGKFSGGGGSSTNLWASPITINQPHSVGFFFVFVTGGQDQSNYLNSGHFFWTFPRLPEIYCRKKTFTKSLGGAWPPWPPPGYATGGYATDIWYQVEVF